MLEKSSKYETPSGMDGRHNRRTPKRASPAFFSTVALGGDIRSGEILKFVFEIRTRLDEARVGPQSYRA